MEFRQKTIKMFKFKNFKSHTGKLLSWKIECNDLSKDDIKCITNVIIHRISYQHVLCPPTKSKQLRRLIALLKHHATKEGRYAYLIIDDVLTTGKSMEQEYQFLQNHGIEKRLITGIVIFARNECPHWITPIFQLNDRFNF